MPSSHERFTQLRWVLNLACAAAIVGSLVMIGLGVAGFGTEPSSGNAWMVFAGLFVLILALVLATGMALILRIEATLVGQARTLQALNDANAKLVEVMQSIAENTRISDAAKSLAHREQELTALRTAIRGDVREERWEAALTLIDEMERRFGYKEEADRFREEVDDARRETIESKLVEAITMVESHFETHDWDLAQSELDRLRNALPENAKVQALQDRMAALKAEHKQMLLAEWEEAVRRSDTDHAIDILREIDQYLSPAEAEALQVSARTVFKEKLLQLGVQFRFAVMEKRWQDALSIGLELIREFPNSRMANEVREAIDTLRERARLAEETRGAVAPEVSI